MSHEDVLRLPLAALQVYLPRLPEEETGVAHPDWDTFKKFRAERDAAAERGETLTWQQWSSGA